MLEQLESGRQIGIRPGQFLHGSISQGSRRRRSEDTLAVAPRIEDVAVILGLDTAHRAAIPTRVLIVKRIDVVTPIQ